MTAAGTPADLDVYEVAYLAGGAARAVEAAVVALVESGRLRVRSPGELTVASLTRRHPVEAAVLDACGPAGHRSVETVCWRVAEDPRLAGLAARLERDGLLAPAGRWSRLRSRGGRPAPTAAGRRALRALRAAPPADAVAAGTSAMRVALGGRDGMPDRALREAVFVEPRPERLPRGRGLPGRMTELARLRQSDYAPSHRAPLYDPGERGR